MAQTLTEIGAMLYGMVELRSRRVIGATHTLVSRSLPALEIPARCCAICGAWLAQDRPLTATACTCHGKDEAYAPRQDVHIDERVFGVLLASGGAVVNIARLLGTPDRKAIWRAVERLRRLGWQIPGVRGRGYRLCGWEQPAE